MLKSSVKRFYNLLRGLRYQVRYFSVYMIVNNSCYRNFSCSAIEKAVYLDAIGPCAEPDTHFSPGQECVCVCVSVCTGEAVKVNKCRTTKRQPESISADLPGFRLEKCKNSSIKFGCPGTVRLKMRLLEIICILTLAKSNQCTEVPCK